MPISLADLQTSESRIAGIVSHGTQIARFLAIGLASTLMTRTSSFTIIQDSR